MRSRASGGVALVLCALLAAACGSSEDDAGGKTDAGSGGSAGTGGTTATGGGAGSAGADGGDGTCHGASDCDSGSFCAVFTLLPLCGGQVDPGTGDGCQHDTDCADAGADFICDNTLCTAPKGGAQPDFHCRKGCSSAADCGPALDCDATHHCVPADCSQPSDCGDDFICAGGKCGAKTCTTDQDCGGYCVNGTCSADIGGCEPAVP